MEQYRPAFYPQNLRKASLHFSNEWQVWMALFFPAALVTLEIILHRKCAVLKNTKLHSATVH